MKKVSWEIDSPYLQIMRQGPDRDRKSRISAAKWTTDADLAPNKKDLKNMLLTKLELYMPELVNFLELSLLA